MKKTLLLSLAFVLFLSGCSLAGGEEKSVGEDFLTPQEARAEAEEFINNNLLSGSGQKAEVSNVSAESRLYKFEVKVNNQTIESYMTKNGETFFPQARNMKNPEKAPSSQSATKGTSTPQQPAQQMSIQQKSQAVVSQTKQLLEQGGENISEEEREKIEQKVKELEELNNSEDTGEEDLKSKITEIQKLVQPVLQNLTSAPGAQESGSVQPGSAN